MQSFTWGTDEAVAATVRAMEATGESYPMTLNYGDFSAVLIALRDFALAELDEDRDETLQERAASLASGIAETLGVEWL